METDALKEALEDAQAAVQQLLLKLAQRDREIEVMRQKLDSLECVVKYYEFRAKV